MAKRSNGEHFGKMDADTRKKISGLALETKRRSAKLREERGIPSALKAIHQNCLDCGSGSFNDVKNCILSDCPLWPYRFGRNPRKDDLQVAEFDDNGNLLGYKPWKGA